MEHPQEYYAFISYKREDEKWAKWLQDKLEHYRFPTTFNGCTDLDEAIKWYRKAAEQGDDAAQYMLGYFYKEGTGGVEQNYEEALKWYGNIYDGGELHPVEKNGKFGFADENDITIILCKWKIAGPFCDGLAFVQDINNHKCGFINKAGAVVIPCKWDSVSSFCAGLVCVRATNGRWGYINKEGKVVISCQWEDAFVFKEELAPVKNKQQKWGGANRTGQWTKVGKEFHKDGFYDGLARVKDANGQWFSIE